MPARFHQSFVFYYYYSTSDVNSIRSRQSFFEKKELCMTLFLFSPPAPWWFSCLTCLSFTLEWNATRPVVGKWRETYYPRTRWPRLCRKERTGVVTDPKKKTQNPFGNCCGREFRSPLPPLGLEIESLMDRVWGEPATTSRTLFFLLSPTLWRHSKNWPTRKKKKVLTAPGFQPDSFQFRHWAYRWCPHNSALISQ